MRVLIQKQRYRIADGLKVELYKSNVGGDPYLENSIFGEVTKIYYHMIEALGDRKSEGHDVRKDDIEIEEYFHIEDEIKVGNDVDIVDSKKESFHTISKTRAVVVLWINFYDGKLKLLPKLFVFPSKLFPNLICMWFIRDTAKNIPPCRGPDQAVPFYTCDLI